MSIVPTHGSRECRTSETQNYNAENSMIVDFLTRLFESEIQRNQQKERKIDLGSEVDENVEKLPKKKTYDDQDLNILAEKYGELVPGMVITIELNECAELLNRKRVRLDAFKTLQNKLQNEYGVELKIYSRRTKL